MTDNYVGNPVQLVSTTTTVEDLMAHGLGWAALKLNEAVKNHNYSEVKKLGKAVAARSGSVNKADGKMAMYPGREGGRSMDVEVLPFTRVYDGS
ncbi:uncharacterized acetyltransferase-like protein [Tanacetum coccineum]